MAIAAPVATPVAITPPVQQPQRVIVDLQVTQKTAELATRQALPPATAVPQAIAPSPAPAVAISRPWSMGLVLDFFPLPIPYLRPVAVPLPPMLVQQYVQPVSFSAPIQAQPPAYLCPPCPACTMPPANSLRAADLDDLARRIHDLRAALGNCPRRHVAASAGVRSVTGPGRACRGQ